MRHLLALLFILLQSNVIISQYDNQTRYPLYPRTDLGLTYAANGSMLKIWSPTSIEAEWVLYETGEGGTPIGRIPMVRGPKGTWTGRVLGDQQ